MRQPAMLLVAVIVAFVLIAGSAMRHTSTTFDEILLPAAGARGFETGDFGLVHLFHPRLLPYLYGLPVALSGVSYPQEQGNEGQRGQDFRYARDFYFGVGNEPQEVAFIARSVGIAIGALLVLVVFLFTRSAAGTAAALVAAVITAFLPDVLAHSGISYNDVAAALVVLAAAWSADRALRDPSPRRVLLCGLVLGLAFAAKYSAIAIGPVILILLGLETFGRWPDRTWLLRVARATPLLLLTMYAALVAIYLGDFTLAEYRAGLEFNILHASAGHGAPAVLLGDYSTTGWWYFFPVAFFLKTSAGLHLLMLLALAGVLIAPVRRPLREHAGSRLRVPLVTGLVFLAFLMAARLNIGFRHALPILPLVAILAAVGVVRLWRTGQRGYRIAIAAALAWHIIAPLTYYPFFISYLSEYTGSREFSYEVLVDSSTDWGQGLIALREFMQEGDIPVVLLSYFGSASPPAYGVNYVPLPSFFQLPPDAAPAETPRWIAISATNLAGNYLAGDPFARFRDIQPYRVIGGSTFIFQLADE